jgi:uncharacterized membrane protein
MSGDTKESGPMPRIEALSDEIFGLALSIGSIIFILRPPGSSSEIFSDIVEFGLSFLILVTVWLHYTSVMSVHPMETARERFLNMLLLFLVSIEPYLLYLVSLFEHEPSSYILDYSSSLFALDMGGMLALLALFTHDITIEEKNLMTATYIQRYRRIRNSLLIGSTLFFVTVIPVFWYWSFLGRPLRFYLWPISIAVFWFVRITQTRSI